MRFLNKKVYGVDTEARVKNPVDRTHKLLSWMVIITLILSSGLLATLGFWTFYPYKTLEVKNAIMVDKVVKQGDIAAYEDDYIKYTDLQGEATRQFVDGIIFDAGSYTSNLPVGEGHIRREVEIPDTLPPGEYSLLVTIRYKVNPIRTVTYTFETNKFKVIPSDVHYDEEQDRLSMSHEASETVK